MSSTNGFNIHFSAAAPVAVNVFLPLQVQGSSNWIGIRMNLGGKPQLLRFCPRFENVTQTMSALFRSARGSR